jgi:uncharacterized membrane protein
MQWFYIHDGQRFGPIEEPALYQLAREGGLAPDDLVWNPTMGQDWKPAATVPDLFAAPPAPAPARPGITANAALMARARASLRGKWALAVGAALLYQVVVSGVNFVPYLGTLAVLIISGPMVFGVSRFFLRLVRRENADVGQLFDGFKLFGKTVAAYLLMSLIIGLWFLLLIVPGVVAAILIPSLQNHPAAAVLAVPFLAALLLVCVLPAIRAGLHYAQVFYILSDQPGLGAWETLQLSRRIMEGRRWKLFCLYCRFIGWGLLSVFTCFIGFLWVFPYMMTACAHFYEDVRTDA